MDDANDGRLARRKKLFVMAAQLGLLRDERIELASMILRRDMTSWKDLTDEQVIRLLDAMEGYAFITYMKMDQ